MNEAIKEAPAVSPLGARLRKRHRHLSRWAAREGLTAYRLFDRDLPGYHFTVDRYDRHVVLAEYPWKEGDALHGGRREELIAALQAECGIARADVVLKTHRRQGIGREQYERIGPDLTLIVREGPLRFEVNLGAGIDVGLFLDHRVTRSWLLRRAAGKRVLNLFSYTGAFTVAAAVGGASRTVSVDLSKRYNDWARRNLELNLNTGDHAFVQADVMAFVRSGSSERFDLIVCDPPPASSSSRAARFEIQQHHERLLLDLAGWLTPSGSILFSSNLGGFTLSPKVLERLPGRELTPDSLPEDFRVRSASTGAGATRRLPHRAWLLGDPWLVASR